MKQVIDIKLITLNTEIDESKFYGFEATGGKGLVVNIGNKFYTLLAKNIVDGNGVVPDSTLENAINGLLAGSFRVHEFDTHKELLSWLVK